MCFILTFQPSSKIMDVNGYFSLTKKIKNNKIIIKTWWDPNFPQFLRMGKACLVGNNYLEYIRTLWVA